MSHATPLTRAGPPTTSELILLGISCIVPFLFFCYGILLHLTPAHPPPTPTSLLYTSPSSPEPTALPPALSHPSDQPTKALTIVVPAYNEALRLPVMLQELHTWLTAPDRTRAEAYGARVKEDGWEVLVVDDGSSDGTDQVALGVAREWEQKGWRGSSIGKGEMRVVKLGRNLGKGGAVRHGVLHSRGARVLFADADGASTFASLEKLQRDLDEVEVAVPSRITDVPTQVSASMSADAAADGEKGGLRKRGGAKTTGPSGSTLGMAIGSRAHLVDTDLVVKRSFLRNLLMHGFHLFVKTLGVRDVRDTQCGFKLFTRPTAALLFPPMNLSRWSFDVELLVLADLTSLSTTPTPAPATTPDAVVSALATTKTRFTIPVVETPIEWHEVDGSKISLAWDSIGMARDLVILRACLMIGRWEAPVLLVEKAKEE